MEGQRMTEAEWLACEDPTPMLAFLQDISYDRKYRLFAISALLPYVLAHGDELTRRIIETAENAAEGELNRSELHRERMGVGSWSLPAVPYLPADLVTRAAGLCLGSHALNAVVAVVSAVAHIESCIGSCVQTDDSSRPQVTEKTRQFGDIRRDCKSRLAVNLRDIIGNPFRSVGIRRLWRTDTVLTLARQMYESRDFGAMPILADALQDAGCENDDILSHCRDANHPHVRGCWVVDLVLGKE
jgi:hypothetical protein